MILTLLRFGAGIAALVAGAELLVRGASRLAMAAGVSRVVVGLTVVAFGTSAPEFAVTLKAALAGQAGIALGNVVGSNILNVLFILGLSALVAPLSVARRLVRLDVPLMIGASLLVWLLALDGELGRLDGALLFAGILAYLVFLGRESRRETDPAEGQRPGRFSLNLASMGAGLALLVLGAGWLVSAAVTAGRALGMSELVIGLTIVALGTSLPEAATSLLASWRGERDIAVGNVVGSNLFNLLGVLGAAALLAPAGVPVREGALTFDIPVMAAAAVACLPVFFTGYTIARWEGLVFLSYYAAYTAFLVLQASEHDALPALGAAMSWFVLPLTAITLAVLALRRLRLGIR